MLVSLCLNNILSPFSSFIFGRLSSFLAPLSTGQVDEARRAYDQAIRAANTALHDVATLKESLLSSLLVCPCALSLSTPPPCVCFSCHAHAKDSLFQGGDVLRDALLAYQQDELANLGPTMESLARQTESTRVRCTQSSFSPPLVPPPSHVILSLHFLFTRL